MMKHLIYTVLKQSALHQSTLQGAVKGLLNARVADGKIIWLWINNKADKVAESLDQSYV